MGTAEPQVLFGHAARRGRRAGALAVSLATVLGAIVALASPAAAAVFVVTAPSFPASVAVGQTFPASVGVQNASTPPESITFSPITVSDLNLVPSCASSSPPAGCAGAVEVGVFGVSGTGTGVGPASCAGTWTINQINPGVWRLNPPGGNGTLLLATNESCQVNFTATALRTPSVDVNAASGVQTTQVASSTPSALGQVFTANQGADITTVTTPTPGLSTVAASTPPQAVIPPSVPGTSTDTATLGSPAPPSSTNGNPPTGTMTFNLFGPDNGNCTGPAVFTNSVPVSGFANYTTSAVAPITTPGTYRWIASYSGDANYTATTTACGDPNETLTFRQAQPSLTTNAFQNATVGQLINDTATLSGGFSPTGTITFRLYGPNDPTCSGPPVYGSIGPVSGNGTYSSGTFAPTVAGTYRWIASYSGDVNNAARTGACNDPGETVTIAPANVTLVTNVAAAETTVGRPLTDVASLAGAFNPTGTITFRLFGPDDANCTVAIFTSTVSVNGNGSYTSGPFTSTTRGTYRWTASYSGDVNNSPLTAGCNAPGETVIVRKPAPPADFDGDGKADVTVFRAGGLWFVKGSAGVATSTVWGASGDVAVAGDYDGDGKADVAVFRPSTGVWYVNRSSGGTTSVVWGASGDIPVVGDFDGDGRTDFTVFRPGSAQWFVNRSTGGTASLVWGVPGDFPVAGDYDGDGKTDVAVWRPGSGTWFVSRSTGGSTATVWGSAGDFPVAGDYDGDGKTDLTVFRSSAGTWFVTRSGGGSDAVSWGASGDKPVAADYDGDKKTDITVFRASEGVWYLRASGGSPSSVPWGTSGDVPVPPPVS